MRRANKFSKKEKNRVVLHDDGAERALISGVGEKAHEEDD